MHSLVKKLEDENSTFKNNIEIEGGGGGGGGGIVSLISW